MKEKSKEGLPDLHQMCLSGVLRRLADVFGLPDSQVVFFSGSNRMQVAQNVAKKAGLTTGFKLPLLLVHVNAVTSGLSENLHGVSSKAIARHGVYAKMAESQSAILKLSLAPAVFDVEVFYVASSFTQALNFAAQWVPASLHNRLNFSVTYAGVDIDIRVELNGAVSTPDREESVDQPNIYEYTASMRIAGYVSDKHVDAVTRVPMVNRVSPRLLLAHEASSTADERVYSSHHTSTEGSFERM